VFGNDQTGFAVDFDVGYSGTTLQQIRHYLGTDAPVGVVITDLDMNNDEQSGIKLIKDVQRIDPLTMTILYTGYPELLHRFETVGLAAFDIFDIVTKAVRGESTVQHLLAKTRAALRYRRHALRMQFLRCHFDSTLFETIQDEGKMLEARSRDVTIVVWKIMGFSRLCDRLSGDPGLITEFLHRYCRQTARVVFDNGGAVSLFAGAYTARRSWSVQSSNAGHGITWSRSCD
jgi:hypothetical protein